MTTLATLRRSRGLTQRQLARKAGVGKRTIEHAEHGVTPHQYTKERIAKALGLRRRVREVWP
jgi:transcriptional regulator with XRE-family HTH domain